MRPLVHRHRSTFLALVGAIAFLLGGLLCFGVIYHRVQGGEIGREKLIELSFISIVVTGFLLIAAFACYRFTHFCKKLGSRG